MAERLPMMKSSTLNNIVVCKHFQYELVSNNLQFMYSPQSTNKLPKYNENISNIDIIIIFYVVKCFVWLK